MQQRLGGLFAHARHAGNVIRGVAHQRQEINNQLWRDAVLGNHLIRPEDSVGHGIDQGDARRHQLGHVFIAGADQDWATCPFRFPRQGANHIVSFDARDSHQRQPHRFHHLMQRLNLRAQIVRHRRAVRFVMLEQFITEGFPFRIKDHDGMSRLILQYQTAQHIQYAVLSPGGLPCAVSQRRKRMIRPIKIGGAVNEDERVFWDLNHNFRACLSDYG